MKSAASYARPPPLVTLWLGSVTPTPPKVVPVMFVLPPVILMPPPPRLPFPGLAVIMLFTNRQFVTVVVLVLPPRNIPAPPIFLNTLSLYLPPLIFTPERENVNPAAPVALSTRTRSNVVC